MADKTIEIQVGPSDEPGNRWGHMVTPVEVLEGLALHQGHSEMGFVVTHIDSGRSVLRGIPDKKIGLIALQDLAALADWTKPADELEAGKLKTALRRIARQVGAPAPRFRK